MENATKSVGQKYLGRRCPSQGRRPCRGKTFDTILDWEAGLPEQELDMAYYHSTVADLNICLGTTLQINPSGNLPLNGKKRSDGKLVICNLQPTKHDKKADLIINTYVDDIMDLLMGHLDLKIDDYSSEKPANEKEKLVEWTISERLLKEMKSKYQQVLKDNKKTAGVKRPVKEEIKRDASKELKKLKKEVVEPNEDFKIGIVKKEEKEDNDDRDSARASEESDAEKSELEDPISCISERILKKEDNNFKSNGDKVDLIENFSVDCRQQKQASVISEVLSSGTNSENAAGKSKDKLSNEDEIDSGFSETPDEG